MVACLKDAGRYARLNARMPSGVLLTGAPGTGKTLLGERVPEPSFYAHRIRDAIMAYPGQAETCMQRVMHRRTTRIV